MGAAFKTEGNMLSILGGSNLNGARVRATDLRTGAALALAGLVAKGETVIEDSWQIERGYNQFISKIASLGAIISSK
jgi:UDP-N-acetylglucosamine 1-carboxyvinyltransferase